jgi:hypothetical protein
MSRHVLADEVVNNGRLKELSLVRDYVLNGQTVTQLSRIIKILGVSVLLIETKSDTNHLISGILQ